MGWKTKIAKYLSYRFILENKDEYSVIFLTQILQVTQAAYYRWIKRGCPQWKININSDLCDKIKYIFDNNKGLYGYPRIKLVLENNNITVSASKVYRYMKYINIKSVIRTKNHFKKPKEMKNTRREYPNIPQRNWKKYKKNQLWVTDVSYIPYGKNNFAYLSVIKDVATGYIVDYKISKINDLKLFKLNLLDALKKRNKDTVLIIHSDHGIQYTSDWFKRFAKNNNILISMSRVGNSVDNGICETFFSQIKSEHLKFQKLDKYEEVLHEIKYYMNYYNFERITLKKGTPFKIWSAL